MSSGASDLKTAGDGVAESEPHTEATTQPDRSAFDDPVKVQSAAGIVETARKQADVPPVDEPPAKPDRQERKEAKVAARRQRKEAKAAARREREEAKVAARREREEAQAAARKEKEEAEAADRKEKEQAEKAAREARQEEAKARRAAEDATAAQHDGPDAQVLATSAATSATARNEPDQAQADDVAATEPTPSKEERQIRADAKAAERSDAEERKAARAAAAEEKMRDKREARKHRADAKQRAKQEKAQAKREAKEAKLASKNRPTEHSQDDRAAELADAEFLKAVREPRPPSAAIGGHAAAVPAVERALFEAAEAAEAEEDAEPAPTTASQDAGSQREPRPEATQPISRVQVDDVPDAEPAKERSGVPAAAVMAAALVGALGLILSVVLAVGALTVAMGAGEGNAIYDPLSAVCDALVGPLKDAFSFSGPNAASREEFLGWGAGSLIYLAVSFAGQAAHRAATRD